MTAVAATAASLLLTACGGATVVDPSWASIPDGASMGEAYPAFAVMIAADGDVEVVCRGDREGRLNNCRVLKASPAGLGFDRAGLSLTPRFQLSPRQVGGAATKASVQFVIRFRMGDDTPAPPPWTGPEPSSQSLETARRLVDQMTGLLPPPQGEELDVDPDRTGKVSELVREAWDEFAVRLREGQALTMARSLTPEQVAALAANQRPPGDAPSEKTIFAAMTDEQQAENAMQDRLRELYCARYVCEFVELAPSSQASVNRTSVDRAPAD